MTDQTTQARGPRLTPEQRAILIRVIAQEHELSVIRDVLADEWLDFPTISDRLIRYYRQRIEVGEITEGIEEARREALQRGAARREVRISALLRHLTRIDRRISAARDDAAFVRLSREYRETLRQLREESDRAQSAPAQAARLAADDLTAGDLGTTDGSALAVVADLFVRRAERVAE